VGTVAACCRVSSGRPESRSGTPGRLVSIVVIEIGSGTDSHRRNVPFLSDRVSTVIVVEHRDRLTQFGFEHLAHLAPSISARGRCIVALGNSNTTSDLVGDVAGVLTGLCARPLGQRPPSRGASKTDTVTVINGDQPT
jgi:putative resolvase